MHITLLGEVNKIKKRASQLGFIPDVTSTLDDLSVIFSNLKTHKLVIMGLVEISGREALIAYEINPYKWRWAEEEGFTRDEIMSEKDLSSQVFTEVSIDEVANSLL